MSTNSSSPRYEDVHKQLSPPTTPVPLITTASSKTHHPKASAQIAALEIHPTLEALLHLLNDDLASAHFLVRHMESPPAHEGMALHALLHRIEGDIENSRCWYLDIMGSDVFAAMWPSGPKSHSNSSDGEETSASTNTNTNTKMSDYSDSSPGSFSSKPEEARAKLPAEVTDLLDRVARLRQHVLKASAHPLPAGVRREDEETALKEISAQEIGRLREHCERKFGTGKLADAREAFVGVGEQRGEISQQKEAMLVGGEGFRHF